MKYKALKTERDEAIARAVEAERLSNVAVVRGLQDQLATLQNRNWELTVNLRKSEDKRNALIVAVQQLFVRAELTQGLDCYISSEPEKREENWERQDDPCDHAT